MPRAGSGWVFGSLCPTVSSASFLALQLRPCPFLWTLAVSSLVSQSLCIFTGWEPGITLCCGIPALSALTS